MSYNQTNILLEAGTNEFELVEFVVGDVHYGINVAKVREIVKSLPVTKMPEANGCVEGIVELRGQAMPLINLGKRLAAENFDTKEKHIIICEFNMTFVGFLVNSVSRIHRITWQNLSPAPPAAQTEIVTGIVKMPDKLIVLLDFERILTEVNPEMEKKLRFVPETSEDHVQQRSTKTIVMVEDSKMLRELLKSTLHEAGYKKLRIYDNGQSAWEELERLADQPDPIETQVQLVITDIEMPKMDGHHLAKRIKEHGKLRVLPVVIFSSLISDEMRRKGESLGVAAQISKPEFGILVSEIDKLIF